MKLIIQPAAGVGPLLAAIAGAKKSVEIAIFRLDRKDVERALTAAAARGVRVTALIAFANRGGEKGLRQLELRFLAAGIIVARTADDLIRYHAKYILIDRRVLYVLSFNFTRLDIDASRGFGIVSSRPDSLREAALLFQADCTRTQYTATTGTFVVSPVNARHVIGTFLRRAKTQLLIYDPMVSDREMLRILQERARAGVEIKVIGHVSGHAPFDVQTLAGRRLHTRTIVRDRRQAFVGSQSLRAAELDARREVGLLIQAPAIVKALVGTFESDWTAKRGAGGPARRAAKEKPSHEPAEASTETSPEDVANAVEVFTNELLPLAATVKQAVRRAIVKAGDDVLHDSVVKDTMKQVVKQAIKEAVSDAVDEAEEAGPPKGAE